MHVQTIYQPPRYGIIYTRRADILHKKRGGFIPKKVKKSVRTSMALIPCTSPAPWVRLSVPAVAKSSSSSNSSSALVNHARREHHRSTRGECRRCRGRHARAEKTKARGRRRSGTRLARTFTRINLIRMMAHTAHVWKYHISYAADSRHWFHLSRAPWMLPSPLAKRRSPHRAARSNLRTEKHQK